MSKKTGLRILVAPLDWGLGHTTRCVPIIKALIALGHSPVVAGNKAQLSFIKNIYTSIETVILPGYDITYSAAKQPGAISLLALLPRITNAIRDEHRWLSRNIADLSIDGIISDNRYGLYHKGIPSVILTHQLEVQTGMGKLANRATQKVHYRYLQQFDEVWVPDVAAGEGLAGALSHPPKLPDNTRYIGLLSQFEGGRKATDDEYLLILLSGPEPQRTMLDDMLWAQAMKYNGRVVFVSGSDTQHRTDVPKHIEWHARVGGAELERLIAGATAVVCRSGYSTIMDLVLLKKKALLIPTPGQTEQEYLAKALAVRGLFNVCEQYETDINKQWIPVGAGERLEELIGHYNDHMPVLTRWLNGIAKKS